jgi:signal transduction histidine kinase
MEVQSAREGGGEAPVTVGAVARADRELSFEPGEARSAGTVAMRYGVAVAVVLCVVGMRLVLQRWMKLDARFLLFLMAVVAAAWQGGLGPGLVAVVLTAAASAFFFLDPVWRLDLAVRQDQIAFALFVAESLVVCALCASLHRAWQRAEEEAERSRALEGAVLEISDAERHRIGQDLHDGLGQQLTGIAFLAKALAQRLERNHPQDAAAAGQVAKLTNEAIARTRDVARGLSPVGVEAGGLEPAVRMLVESTGRMFGIASRLEWDPAVSVDDGPTAVHLYRIAQEAVGNAVRHGKAKNIVVSLIGRDGEIELRVADDGEGLDETAARASHGMGLRIMRYRAGIIGGELEVRKGDGGGTSVRATVRPAK